MPAAEVHRVALEQLNRVVVPRPNCRQLDSQSHRQVRVLPYEVHKEELMFW